MASAVILWPIQEWPQHDQCEGGRGTELFSNAKVFSVYVLVTIDWRDREISPQICVVPLCFITGTMGAAESEFWTGLTMPLLSRWSSFDFTFSRSTNSTLSLEVTPLTPPTYLLFEELWMLLTRLGMS